MPVFLVFVVCSSLSKKQTKNKNQGVDMGNALWRGTMKNLILQNNAAF